MEAKWDYRIGIGFDAHRFCMGRRLILGGIEIPFDRGLQGHSDADALIHAIIDAILGAVNGGDIGILFPDSDPQYKDIASTDLLRQITTIVAARHAVITGIDCVVIAEQPKIRDHAEEMKQTIGRILKIDPECISIKGKTTEGMGFTGRSEGIAVQAVVMIRILNP